MNQNNTYTIYSLKKYCSFRDNNNEPLNCQKISGDIIKITNELKNNKGYHMFLKHDVPYILYADIDKFRHLKKSQKY